MFQYNQLHSELILETSTLGLTLFEKISGFVIFEFRGLEHLYLKKPYNWPPHGQICVIIEGTASFTRDLSLLFYNFGQKVTWRLATSLGP